MADMRRFASWTLLLWPLGYGLVLAQDRRSSRVLGSDATFFITRDREVFAHRGQT